MQELMTSNFIQNTLSFTRTIIQYDQLGRMKDRAFMVIAIGSFINAVLFPESVSAGISLGQTKGIYRRSNHKLPDMEYELKKKNGSPLWFRIKIKTNVTAIFEWNVQTGDFNAVGVTSVRLYKTKLFEIKAIATLSTKQVGVGFNFTFLPDAMVGKITTRTARYPIISF